jgi:hypothetical protein
MARRQRIIVVEPDPDLRDVLVQMIGKRRLRATAFAG